MKNLKFLQSCLVSGQHVEAGTILENVDNHVAAELIEGGRAKLATTETFTQRDPEVIKNRDPEPAKKIKTKATKNNE
jgi:hypothetical protein